MIPHILKDFNLFGDGNNWQGQIPELTLPTMARRMVEYEGGGMEGPIEVDQGNELQEFEWKLGGMTVDGLFDHYGSPIHDASLLRLTGSYESDEDGNIIPVEIVMRGRHKTIEMGDASKGDNNQISITTTLTYFKLTIDGEDVIERDVPGYVFKVRGVDRLAERRAALGVQPPPHGRSGGLTPFLEQDITMTQQTEIQIEAAAAQTATAPGVPTEVVELETPLQRGKNTVTEITVRKPMSGGMRGVSLVDIMNLDVAALTKVMPRITTPALTEAELKTMDIVDLVQLGTALNGFLTPKKFKEIEAQRSPSSLKKPWPTWPWCSIGSLAQWTTWNSKS